MSVLTVPKSQALRFIRKESITDVQSYDNRFVHDLVYAKTLPYFYSQKFIKTDPLWCQYRTDYTNITVNRVDSDNNRTALSPTLIYTDSSDLRYYNVDISLLSLSGCYFIEIIGDDIDKPLATFQSEYFNVSEELNDSIWIKWRGNLTAYDDMMDWESHSLYQGIRLIGRDRELTPEQNKTIYDNSDYAPVTLKSKPIRNMELEINNAPYWMIEKVNLGLSHDEFFVQEVQYNTSEVLQADKLGDLLTKKATVVLTQVDFEDGEDTEITGDIPQSFILFNDSGDLMLYNDSGDFTKANN